MTERTCSIDGCPNPHQATGLCGPHYHRKRRTGSATTLTRHYEPKDTHPPTCSEPNCDEPYHARFKCVRHYRIDYRLRRTLDTEDRLILTPAETEQVLRLLGVDVD